MGGRRQPPYSLRHAAEVTAQRQSLSRSAGQLQSLSRSARALTLGCFITHGCTREGCSRPLSFSQIGQQFSTRVDVLSPEFVKELEKLQDNVPPFGSDAAIAIIERGLGKPIMQVYEEFDPVPIAAASLGQVTALANPSELDWTLFCWTLFRIRSSARVSVPAPVSTVRLSGVESPPTQVLGACRCTWLV